MLPYMTAGQVIIDGCGYNVVPETARILRYLAWLCHGAMHGCWAVQVPCWQHVIFPDCHTQAKGEWQCCRDCRCKSTASRGNATGIMDTVLQTLIDQEVACGLIVMKTTMMVQVSVFSGACCQQTQPTESACKLWENKPGLPESLPLV